MDPPEGVGDDGAGFFVVDDKGHLLTGGLQEQVLIRSAGRKNIDKNNAFLMEMSGALAGKRYFSWRRFHIWRREVIIKENGVDPCIIYNYVLVLIVFFYL